MSAMKLSDTGVTLAALGTATAGSGTSSFLKIMDVIGSHAAAIGVLVSIIFGLLGLVFAYLNYREVRKARVLNSKAEENSIMIKKLQQALEEKSQ